jgi:CheY-like chemotaxis protein
MSAGKAVDVVVSDLELPDGDGCALLRQLKVRDMRFKMPAIAVTGYSESRWRNQAAGCGFERYVVKPFALESLVAAIAELSGFSGRVSSVREASEPAGAEARRAARDLAGQ